MTIDPKRRQSTTELALNLAGGEAANSLNAALYAWFHLFKTAQIHAIDNQALARPIQVMADLTASMIATDGRLSLQTKDRAVFVNSTKLKLSTDEYVLANAIFDFFEERGMGGFTVEAPLTPEMLRRLLMLMVYAPAPERKFDRLEAAIKATAIPFRINKPLGTSRKSDSELTLERRGYTFFTYSKLVVLYRSLLADEKLNANRRHYLMKKIARTVQALVDICLEDDHTFISVAAVKSGESYAPHHAANTAILAIALGDKIGMNKVELADVGMAAVFHDIGLHTCAAELTDKRATLDQKERFIVAQHPIQSVEFLLDEKRFNRAALIRVIAAFEHHRLFAGTGYPPASRRPHVVSRMIAIAAVYDALTTERPWRKAYLPDEALAALLRESGKQFDPALLKIFVNTVGLYPVGTLVRLDSGEMGIVVYGSGEGERVSRPIVTLVNRDGKPSDTIDLMEKTLGGAFKRMVVGTDDPSKYGMQPSGIIAASAALTVS